MLGWARQGYRQSAARCRLYGSLWTVPLRLVFIIERLFVLLVSAGTREGEGGVVRAGAEKKEVGVFVKTR